MENIHQGKWWEGQRGMITASRAEMSRPSSLPLSRLSVKTILVKLYSRVINIDWKKEKAETADVIS